MSVSEQQPTAYSADWRPQPSRCGTPEQLEAARQDLTKMLKARRVGDFRSWWENWKERLTPGG